MAKTVEEREALIEVSALGLGQAWLNAMLASGKEEERPTLCRTLSVEVFDGGVQCIATNGTALIRTWSPVETQEWPDVDEAPRSQFIVHDVDGFGSAFMGTLVKATKDEAHMFERITLASGRAHDDDKPALGDGMEHGHVVLRACGQRMDLPLFEGTYPDWRNLQLDTTPVERLDALTVAPPLVALLGKIKGATSIDLAFHGDDKHIGFVARSGAIHVARGAIMPMRKVEGS